MNPEVPPDLSRIVLRALEKDPALRYQTARDLLADLRRLARETDRGGPHHITGAPPTSRRRRRRATTGPLWLWS